LAASRRQQVGGRRQGEKGLRLCALGKYRRRLFTGSGKPLSKPLPYKERGFNFSPFPTREGG